MLRKDRVSTGVIVTTPEPVDIGAIGSKIGLVLRTSYPKEEAGAAIEVGVLSINKAIDVAQEAELDLVILSLEADPPVDKVMDYRYNISLHSPVTNLRISIVWYG
ncbi:hypothetical protein Tsubulata_050603 [Turnera subulata]|uniref:Translation initiation factor 3 N-terminal domain-containing protein n=1 Tax=Turnera subulata TaxID=218843 RepID=A0A9Q0JJJ8_9ROSI|nr:hypothetical protein Tsubulata_050603 [Turnera subulata]